MADNDKVRFVPFNPCKKCLKRPVCNKECQDLSDHSDTQECIMALSIFLSMIISTITVIIFLTKFKLVFLYFIIFLLVVTYFYSTKRLIEDGSDLKDQKFIFQILIAILNPWGEATTYIIDTFKLDNKMNKYSLRFKKNLWKHKYK